MPKRVQMSRQHPWRAENPDAVVVARPSRWGNPFKVGGEYVTTDFFDSGDVGVLPIDDLKQAAGAFHSWIRGEFFVREFDSQRDWIIEHIEELTGRDLACWCPLDTDDGYYQCHADALLELANGGAS